MTEIYPNRNITKMDTFFHKVRNKTLIVILLIINVLCISCRDKKEYTPTPYQLEIPRFFPNVLNIPNDNPMTEEGVLLGRYLFYDEHLCGYLGIDKDSLMSCATCHIQENAFECGINHPKYIDGKTYGLSGIYTPHSMLSLCNLVFNSNGYFWNGMIYTGNPNSAQRNLEDIVLMGITAPHEMNSTYERAVFAIQSNTFYPPLFEKAFGNQDITIEKIAKAIAQFIRTFISSNSRFDKYIRGEEQLTADELNGLVLFMTEEGADCFHCHGGDGNLLMTTNLFYNNGLDSVFNDPRDRFALTGQASDRGAYRAPSLRNIALTAPYMHDGRFKTLEEVIDFYSEGLHYSEYVHPLMHKILQGGNQLTIKQKQQLKAFLNTLTDEQFIKNEKFSNPWGY
jgi:cytochrome c peroxidase